MEKCVFSRCLKLVRLSQVLMTVGKLFHRDAAATANEQSPALVRVRFISIMLLFADYFAVSQGYIHNVIHCEKRTYFAVL